MLQSVTIAMNQLYSRREMLRLSAGSLLALGLWPGALRAEGKGQPGRFSFIVVNDIHYFDNLCGDWLQAVLHTMKNHPERPEFCAIVGDLAQDGTLAQLSAVKELFQTLRIPVYCVPGNHDYATYTDRSAYEQVYKNSVNYQFEHKGWQFVALDTTQGLTAFHSKIQAPTFSWLDDTLPKLSKTRPTVMLTHFPLGPGLMMRPTNSDSLLDRFRDYNLQAAFSGHWHGSTEAHLRGATLTTNKCCSFHVHNHDGTPEKGYFLCRAEGGVVSRTFIRVA